MAAVVAIVVLASGALFYLPSAAITVKARSEPVARDFEIRVDPSAAAASSIELAIPAKTIDREVEGSKTAQATGQRNIGKTASGFVSIYNFSKTTLILKAATTELTANGRKYYFTQDVGGIRPTARIGLEDQEIDETSLIPPVPIVAAGAGEEYNLPAGTRFEISNEAFGSQPTTLYAMSSENIAGGTTQHVRFVTASDVDGALGALSEELAASARVQLSEANPGQRFAPNAMDLQIIEQASQYQPGREAEEFSVSIRMKIRALTYEDSDLREVVFSRVRRLMPETKILDEESAVIDASLVNVNLGEGLAMLHAHFEGEVKYVLDSAELLEKVKGRSVEEIREIFLSKPEIETLEVELAPFWVKTAPKLNSRIRLDVH